MNTMKMAVLEVYDDGKAAVLDTNGQVRLIDDEAYQEGQILMLDTDALDAKYEAEIIAFPGADVSQDKKVVGFGGRLRRHASSIAAAFAMIFIFAVGTTTYANGATASTVRIASGANLTYDLNYFNRVIRVHGDDESGAEIAGELIRAVKGKNLTDAVPITLSVLNDHAYLTNDNLNTVFTVSAPSDNWVNRLNEEVDSGLETWDDAVRVPDGSSGNDGDASGSAGNSSNSNGVSKGNTNGGRSNGNGAGGNGSNGNNAGDGGLNGNGSGSGNANGSGAGGSVNGNPNGNPSGSTNGGTTQRGNDGGALPSGGANGNPSGNGVPNGNGSNGSGDVVK